MAQKLRALAVLAEKLLGLPEPTSGSSQASATPSLAIYLSMATSSSHPGCISLWHGNFYAVKKYDIQLTLRKIATF